MANLACCLQRKCERSFCAARCADYNAGCDVYGNHVIAVYVYHFSMAKNKKEALLKDYL